MSLYFIIVGQEQSKDDKIDKKDNLSWGLAASEFKSDDSKWILDSGASQHLSGTKSYLSDIQPTSKSIRVVIADGTELKATHVGNLKSSRRTRASYASIV